jgi:CRISPR-associated endoribonuclease Cas6
MRLHLTTNSSRFLFPYNYQNRLTGAIHKWIGQDNEYHGRPALFSFSSLSGGQSIEKRGLRFSRGAHWFISAYDIDLIKSIIFGINRNPTVTEDMVISSITIQEDPAFGETGVFRVGSPILIKQKLPEGRIHHCVFSDDIADKLMTETLRFKLIQAGLPAEGMHIKFKRDYPMARAKVIHYNGIGNRVNFCPVSISGSPTQLAFAWNVGVGHSTGIGFGSLI